MRKNPLITKNSRVLVLGYGITGRAAVRYLLAQDAAVYVSDTCELDQIPEPQRFLLESCAGFEGGGHSMRFLDDVNMIFISPGVPEDIDVVREADRRSIPVMGELALAAPLLDDFLVVAVSGTNGKTTVTTLLGEMFRADGRDVFVGGNIGTPLLEALMAEDRPEVLVLEVSSFQLLRRGAFRPDIAVLLNITPDHLDRHGDLAGYFQAKARLFSNQEKDDIAIFCGDDLICRELAAQLSIEPCFFGHDRDAEAQICESEILLQDGSRIEKYVLSESCDTHTGRLNCAAAILAAHRGDCRKANIEKALVAFIPLPHRMEMVAQVDGVWYCNDSKATNTGAVISALRQTQGKVVLIAGGKEKGEDYTILRDIVYEKVKHLILLGEAAPALAKCLSDIVAVEYADSMEEAVRFAQRSARGGDMVLLSPACASFDMFASYKERGDIFRRIVTGIEAESEVIEV